jgi:protein-L-isoaspartate(D-aspartate) O-methyltransferase
VARIAAGRREARLITALDEVPRYLFFPEGIEQGFPNEEPVPLRDGRSIPPVSVVERMIRALELDGTERVLDVSCGSGYQAAVLSRLAREVISLETDAELVSRADSLLAKLGRSNVQVVKADGYAGWRKLAPYQAIMVSAGAPELPAALVEQLDLDGRLVIALGDADAQLIERMRKRSDALDSETIGACKLDLLPTPNTVGVSLGRPPRAVR